MQANGVVSYQDVRNSQYRVNLVSYDDKRQESLNFKKDGEYIVFAIGGSDGELPNRTRMVLFMLADICNYPIFLDSTDNLAFFRVVLMSDNDVSDEHLNNFTSFLTHLKLLFVHNNIDKMTMAELVSFFSSTNIPIVSKQDIRRLVISNNINYNKENLFPKK